MRLIHKAVMPMNGGSIKLITRKHILKGEGMGSVILDGGMGGQSSYHSIDDYINTTGINPELGLAKTGRGLESMNKKLESLLVKSKKLNPKKEKNINFNL